VSARGPNGHGSGPPAPGALRPFDFPDVHAERLESGLELRVGRMPRLPVVTMSLVLPAGESALEADDAGLAVLAGDALEGGTGTRSGAELAEALEGIGAGFDVSTGWDGTAVALSCIAERKEDAASLLAEIVLDPAFPEDEVERARNQRLARIRQRRMTPSSLASDESVRLFYAAGVPYGRPLAGTETSVASLDRERIAGFAASHYRPAGGGLVVVGDVDPDEISDLFRGRTGGWAGSPPGRRDFDALPRTDRREVHVVHRPGSVQSEVRVGHPGVAKASRDYFPLLVANTILGGAFTSRLNLNLRERHGFTYGARSRFSFRRNAGPFYVATAVDNDSTAPAVREIVGELEAAVSGGFTDDEVQAARDYIAGVFPLRLETTGQVAARIAELIVYDLPDDWHARYRDRIRAVDRARAEEAVGRHVRPGEAQIVVVGDADAVAGPLEALELGPVTVHTLAT
jgi:zinc protease